MDNHYLPQYYLRGFCQGSGQGIWVYDKRESRKFATQIKSIASICDFYPPELEKHLTENVEGPANCVLKKIRNRELLTPTEKITLSIYIAVMWKRVPEGKNRFKEQVPGIATDFQEKLHRQLEEFLAKNPSKEDLVQRRKAEIDDVLDRYSQEPPEEIWHNVIPTDRASQMVEALATMTWRFLTFDEEPAFLTGDNPVFYFSRLGIGRAESELSFPVSSHVTLWATRRIDLTEGYFPATTEFVKEINRRTASITTRYMFHANDEDWILPFSAKGSWRLNRIR